MGGLTSAVQWWEESQLRVLVLTSMAIQVLLFIFSSSRRFAIPGWVRSMTWLAYLAADSVAIYALATLFNRHHKDGHDVRKGGGTGAGGGIVSTLEVMWAPVLLIHLGGHDGITAYNIEDNELWGRHLLTAVSQVTVAIYVFSKSWPPGGDDDKMRLLLAAGILLFVPGVLKCFTKPWALKSASIYSLVRTSRGQNEDQDMYPLQEYVKRGKEFVEHQEHGNENGVDHAATTSATSVEDDGGHSPSQGGYCAQALLRTRNYLSIFRQVHQWRQRIRERLQQLDKLVDDEGTRTWPPYGEEEDKDHSLPQGCAQLCQQQIQNLKESREVTKRLRVLGEASDKLFVDLSSPYSVRLRIHKYFWGISQDRAYGYAQGGLAAAFHLLYTKLKTAGFATETEMVSELDSCDRLKISCRELILLSRMALPLVSIGLFHFHLSHSEAAQNDIIDVKITYAIFCCTAVLEFFSAFPIMLGEMASSDDVYASQEQVVKWPEMVAQYSLIGYFASNQKYSKWMRIAGVFGCKDFVDQRMLCMEPCPSSARISRLVLGYLKDGWKKEIHDAPSYRRFNDHSTHWPMHFHLDRNGCGGRYVKLKLPSMRKRPFDESVLLWHIATDICFFSSPTILEHRCAFAEVPPAWKLEFIWVRMIRTNEQRHGCRQELTPCRAVQCKQMSNYMAYLLFVNPEMLLPGTRRNVFTDAYDGLSQIFKDMDMDMDIPMDRKPPNVKKDEWVMQQRVINTMRRRNRSKKASEPCSEEEPKKVSPSKEISNKNKGGHSKEVLIDDAWALAQRLLDNNKGDENKMWEEIQRVWVEMLCFSASRCRGYLHAKALGQGGEFLSYVWLTLFHMGMETFTDKLQREEPPSQEFEAGNNNPTAPPSTPNGSTTGTTAPSTSEICIAEDDMVNVSTTGTTTTSTSKICIIDVLATDAGTAPSTSKICMAKDDIV